jgi:hypothetical protein
LEKLNKSSDEAKLNAATMLLIRTTKVWWINWVEDLEAGRTTKKIENWEEMKVALKA